MSVSRLPNVPKSVYEHNKELGRWLQALVRDIELRLEDLERANATGWIIQNLTSMERTLDTDNTNLEEIVDFLGRLIQDLKDGGRIGGPG